MHLTLNCDGASRGNPGLAATGFVIRDDSGRVIDSGGTFLGVETNNWAEYQAVIEALGRILSISPKVESVDVYLDSQLVVEQLNGHYRVKKESLRSLFADINSLTSRIGNVKFHHVPRELNKEADGQANKVLDEREKDGRENF